MVAMNDNSHNPTLITGGTGKTGRRVAERLEARGLPVRIGSRSADPAFDWEDRATWAAALEGAGGLYVSFYPDVVVPGAAATVGALAAQARDAGVQRIVLLSGRGEKEAQDTEARVREAFPAATIVRCSWFNQNFDEGQLAEPVLAGELALPVDAATVEPFVDADDIADVAAAALTEDGHAGELYELTGPELLTFGQAVERISAASGREVRFVPISHEDFSAGMAGQELPEDMTWLLGYLFTEVLDGRNASLADGVQRALGRKPRGFGDYAQKAAAAGAWG
jgi:uncharacterized protein YbjT (DUF2867 family)